MSKSLGNVVDPHEVMKEYGADILRLWTVTSDYSEDVKIGKDVMKNVADVYRRLRNTFRFLLGALDGFTPSERVAESDYNAMPELEKFILQEMARVDLEVRTSIDKHDYGAMTQALYSLCNTTLSSFYFDIRKDRLYCDRPDSFERRACRTVMAELLDFLLTRLAPIIPFTTEEVWQYRPHSIFENADSIHLRTFSGISVQPDSALLERWADVQKVRDVVLAALEPARASKEIGSSLEAAPEIYVSGKYADAVAGLNMAELCITSSAQVIAAPVPAGAVTLQQTEGVGVVFRKAEGKKCERCWKVLPEVGTDPEYPDLSLRDADAVRHFVSHKKAA
jgi:isoleucyl-tRNA synthetase